MVLLGQSISFGVSDEAAGAADEAGETAEAAGAAEDAGADCAERL
jgi:hypothetical protein